MGHRDTADEGGAASGAPRAAQQAAPAEGASRAAPVGGSEVGGAAGVEPVGHMDRRPWGNYLILADEPGHKVKRIEVLPGKRLSLQRHTRRAEHWFVVAGELVATVGAREIVLEEGEAVDVPRGSAHRMENRSETAGTFIEIQTGDYFGEDDIERLEDDYGRA